MPLTSLVWPIRLGAVYLRPMLVSDVTDQYLSWFHDPIIQEYISFANDSVTRDDLVLYVNQRSSKSDCLFLGIFDNSNDLLVGTLKLEPIDYILSTAELGILIGPSLYRGKGLGRLVLSEVINLLPASLGISSLTLGVSSSNIPAIRLYRSLGFVVVSKSHSSFRMALQLSS